jgi:hypothetical protein
MNFTFKDQCADIPVAVRKEILKSLIAYAARHEEVDGAIFITIDSSGNLNDEIELKWTAGQSQEKIEMAHKDWERLAQRIDELFPANTPEVDQLTPAPRAAEIQWRELITGDAHAGEGGYLVEQRGSAGWAAYFQSSRFEDRLYPTLEAAKQACQDHKQGRLEELL